jgi:hypothetical protein
LNPSDYHVVEIRDALENSDLMTRDELDVVLSDAILRYGRDLTGARISLLPGIKSATGIGGPRPHHSTFLPT